MTKRARYDGPYAEVFVADSAEPLNEDGSPRQWVVKKGGLLPDDAPARIRDEFLHKDNPYWSEVNQADQAKKADNEKKDGD